MRLSRRHKPSPVGDGKLNGRKCARHEDRTCNDDAGGGLLVNHEISAEAEH